MTADLQREQYAATVVGLVGDEICESGEQTPLETAALGHTLGEVTEERLDRVARSHERCPDHVARWVGLGDKLGHPTGEVARATLEVGDTDVVQMRELSRYTATPTLGERVIDRVVSDRVEYAEIDRGVGPPGLRDLVGGSEHRASVQQRTPPAGDREFPARARTPYDKPMRLRILTIVIMACAQPLLPAFGRDGTDADRSRMNIVLFLVDDLGWQDTSVPMHSQRTRFNDRYRTPNLERLAARGMRFTNAYASAPVCTPTRTAIMTGKAPARTHITYWTLHKDTDTSRPRDDLSAPDWNLNGLQPGDHQTLPEVLRSAGYRTIHSGKAHLGSHDTQGADPTSLGFGVNIAGHASGGPASYQGLDHFTVAGRKGEPPHGAPSVWDIPGLEAYHGHDIYLTEALAIEACRAIRDSVEVGEPFFLQFAPYAVHAPIMGNTKYEPNYPDLDATERAYASMIETCDAALGALVATLEETGQIDNTAIIFTSDNGGLSAHARGEAPDGETRHTHNAPLRSGKGSAYEGGTRVPTIIAWPGVTDEGDRREPAGRGLIENTPIISHDFFPTVIAMAGLQNEPRDTATDGQDLTPLLKTRAHLVDADRTLGWNQPHQWGAPGPGIEPFTSIRHGDWKLIYFHAGRRFEMYNLATDIGETEDLAIEASGRLLELARDMQGWISDTGAQLSIDKATGEEIEGPAAAAESWPDR